MNKSKRYNKSERVKRFRKTKKGGSWLNGLFGIFKSKNATKMEPNPIQGAQSNSSKVTRPINKPVGPSNALKIPNPSTISPPLNKPVVSNVLPKI